MRPVWADEAACSQIVIAASAAETWPDPGSKGEEQT